MTNRVLALGLLSSLILFVGGCPQLEPEPRQLVVSDMERAACAAWRGDATETQFDAALLIYLQFAEQLRFEDMPRENALLLLKVQSGCSEDGACEDCLSAIIERVYE